MKMNLHRIAIRMVIALRLTLFGTLAYCYIGILVSCQSDDRQQPAAVAVQFTTSVSSSLSSGEGRGEASTRAYNDTWEVGDEVGMYMLATSGNLGTSIPGLTDGNHHYSTDNEVDAKLVGLTAGADPLYFPIDGSNVRFTGYGPYRSEITNSIYPVNVSGGTPQVLKDLDLIYHKGATVYNKTSSEVPLAFSHKLSKVTISVTLAKDADDIDLTDQPGLSISGMPATANFSLSSGALSNIGGNDAVITPAFNKASNADQAIWEAILVPHTSNHAHAEGRVLSFSFGGNEYTYTLGSSREFLTGTAYVYSFMISADDIKLSESIVTDWSGGLVAWGDYLLTSTNTVFGINKLGANKKTGVDLQVNFRTTATGFTPTIVTSESESFDGEKVDWIKSTCTTGSITDGWRDHTLTFTVDRNPYNSARTGYILFKLNDLTIATTIAQDTGEGLHLTKRDSNPTYSYPAGTGSFRFGTNSAEAPVIKYSTTGNWEDATDACDWFTVTKTTKSTYTNGSNTDNSYAMNYAYEDCGRYGTQRKIYIHARVEDDAITEKKYLVTQNPIQITPQKATKVADGMSNCYVVGGNTTVVFPVTRAYSNTSTSTLQVGNTYSGGFFLDPVWNENGVVNISNCKVEYLGADAVVTIQTNGSLGNAVIALKRNDNKDIVWSYHIWRGDYGTSSGYMDRALGANQATFTERDDAVKAAGLYYQWGRKDPFPKPQKIGYNSVTVSDLIGKKVYTTSSLTPLQSIQNPNYFTTGSWRGSDDGYSWNDKNTSLKTIYDPCPHGYRVASTGLSTGHFTQHESGVAMHWTQSFILVRTGTSTLTAAISDWGGELNRGGVWTRGSAGSVAEAFVEREGENLYLKYLNANSGLQVRCVPE